MSPMRSFPALSAAIAMLGAVAATALGGCGKAPNKDLEPVGCVKDTDCKGNRVCLAGACQDAPAATPAPAPTPAPTQAPATTATATASAGAQPEGSGFRAVPEAEWKPLIGPRLRKGAVVAHAVFEGPFGPTAKGLFVITREDKDFYATVWADGHGYRNGPLANNGGAAAKIPAVAFFDADGDGAMDVLVLALYTPAGGGSDKADNVLLRWKGTSVLRLQSLERDIAGLETVAAVRAKLKR